MHSHSVIIKKLNEKLKKQNIELTSGTVQVLENLENKVLEQFQIHYDANQFSKRIIKKTEKYFESEVSKNPQKVTNKIMPTLFMKSIMTAIYYSCADRNDPEDFLHFLIEMNKIKKLELNDYAKKLFLKKYDVSKKKIAELNGDEYSIRCALAS